VHARRKHTNRPSGDREPESAQPRHKILSPSFPLSRGSKYVHHGIWDHDNPSPPILADVQIKGKRVPVVAQPSKQAFLYVFNRESGEPVWPIEERPVEKGDVPGEWYSPTQPFPTAPPAYEIQGVDESDLIDFTPELNKEALEIGLRRTRWNGPLLSLLYAPSI